MSIPVHTKLTFAIVVGIACLLTASTAQALFIVADSNGSDWTGSPGEQGYANWYYGYYDRTADLADGGDGTYDAASEFTEFLGGAGQGPHSSTNHWSGSQWQYYSSDWQYLILARNMHHPTIENANRPEGYVIRRWISEVNGLIHIDGYFRNTASDGDGTNGRIFINGIEKFAQATHQGVYASFLLHEPVNAGDSIDFMTDIGPGAWGGPTPTTQADSTSFYATISVPEPTTLTLFGLGLIGLIGCRRRRQGR